MVKTNMQKDKRPVVAICYDFDKTLSPDDMQNYSLIPETGKTTKEFWEECDRIAKENEMDSILAYMYKIIKEGAIESNSLRLTRKAFNKHGKTIKLFNGVRTWFNRIEKIASERNVEIEHYVISAGIKEIIEGTKIAKNFKKILASTFYYNKKTELAEWPAQVVNATTKTQHLFRISKNALDLSDEVKVHKAIGEDKIRIPFTNIIYIGDSITDVPAMKIVTKQGGTSIGVYNPENGLNSNLEDLKRDKRISYFAPADYSKGSEIERIITEVVDGVNKKTC